jgi:hypothetical protein
MTRPIAALRSVRAPHHGARPVGEGTPLRAGVPGREAPGPEVFAILLTPGQEQLTPVLQAIFESGIRKVKLTMTIEMPSAQSLPLASVASCE